VPARVNADNGNYLANALWTESEENDDAKMGQQNGNLHRVYFDDLSFALKLTYCETAQPVSPSLN
jgi:hypothetical protein